MKINDDYTQDDHLKREEDAYANLKYQITLRWLSAQGHSGKRLLNVGCGGGDFNAMGQEAGFQVDGIEPDEKALAIARKRSLPGARLENTDIFNFQPGYTYDIIVMHDVLEHIENHEAAITAISNLMSCGSSSKFVLSVPAHQWLFGFHDKQLGHFRRYSRKALVTVLEKHFEIKKVRRVGILGIPAALWYSKFRRTPYPVGGKSIGNRIFELSCKLESIINLHLGTSIMILATPKIT